MGKGVSPTEYINKQKAIREKGVNQFRKQVEVLAKKGIVLGSNGNFINTNAATANPVNGGVANGNVTNPVAGPNNVPTIETTLAFDPVTHEFYDIQSEGPRNVDGVSKGASNNGKNNSAKKQDGINVPYSVVISISLIAIICAVFLFIKRKRDNTKEPAKAVTNVGTFHDDDAELLSTLPQAKQTIPDTYKPIFNVNVNDDADPNYYGYQNEVPQRLSTYNNANGYAISNEGQFDGQFEELANPYGNNLLNQNYVDGNNIQFTPVNQVYQDPSNNLTTFNYVNQTYPEVTTTVPLTNVGQVYPEGTLAVPLNNAGQVFSQSTLAVPLNNVGQIYPQGTLAVPLNTMNQVFTEAPSTIQFNTLSPVTTPIGDISIDNSSFNIINPTKEKEPEKDN